MKTLSQLLREIHTPRPTASAITKDTFLDQFTGKSLCDLLSARVPPTGSGGTKFQFGELQTIVQNKERFSGKSEEIYHFFDNIKEWVGGLKSSSRSLHDSIASGIVSDVTSCSSRAGWSKFTGRVYRGVSVNANFVKNLIIPDVSKVKILNLGGYRSYRSLVGTYVYQSNLPAQSWSTDLSTSVFFSNPVDPKYPAGPEPMLSVVMEYNIQPNESISLKYLGNYVEREIIKIGKGPITVKCHIPFAVLGEPMLPKGDHEGPLDVLYRRGIIKAFPR